MLFIRVRDFFKSLFDKGILSTVKLLLSTLSDRLSKSPFAEDTLFNTNDKNPNIPPYLPSRYRPLQEALKKISIKESDVFVDIGAGKGRAMLIAYNCGFKKVKGIELSRPLYIKANEILTKAKINYELINSDILEYKISIDDNFFYLYDPFEDKILESFLSNLCDNKQKVRLLYHNNIDDKEELFNKFPKLKLNSKIEVMGNHYSLFHLD